ncbi:MAG: DUF1801 domain-containing protein [Micrococcaceae bacterium]
MAEKRLSKAAQDKLNKTPSELIDERIARLPKWQAEIMTQVRELVKKVNPDVIEEWKWRGVPIWEHNGMLFTGETYKKYVKLTFAKGAKLDDSANLFNSSLAGNTRRAIDIHENDELDYAALAELINQAVQLNLTK